MRDYQPFDLIGPLNVYGAFYNNLANNTRAIQALQGTTVQIAQLSEISSDLGEVRGGYFITENLYFNTDASNVATFFGPGCIMSGESFTTDGTNYYNIAGFSDNGASASTLQFALSATTGAALAGAGAVTLDANGITLTELGTFNGAVKWYSGSGDLPNYKTGDIYSNHAGGATPNRSSYLVHESFAEAGGSGSANIQFYLRNGAVNYGGLFLSTIAPIIQVRDYASGLLSNVHYGDTVPHALVSNTTTETDIYPSRTIKANSLGANGNLKFSMRGVFINTSASTRTYRVRVYFGATVLFDTTYTVTVANAVMTWELVGGLANANATNVNVAEMKFSQGIVASTTTGVASTETIFENAAAIDTTADATFKITVTMSTNLTTVSTRVFQADMLGPNYSA